MWHGISDAKAANQITVQNDEWREWRKCVLAANQEYQIADVKSWRRFITQDRRLGQNYLKALMILDVYVLLKDVFIDVSSDSETKWDGQTPRPEW